MKKLVLLVFALNICLGTFAQFTPGDTLKYRISLKDKAATDYSLQKPEMYLSKKSIERRKRQGLEKILLTCRYVRNMWMRYARKAFMCLLQENGIISSLFPVMIVC